MRKLFLAIYILIAAFAPATTESATRLERFLLKAGKRTGLPIHSNVKISSILGGDSTLILSSEKLDNFVGQRVVLRAPQARIHTRESSSWLARETRMMMRQESLGGPKVLNLGQTAEGLPFVGVEYLNHDSIGLGALTEKFYHAGFSDDDFLNALDNLHESAWKKHGWVLADAKMKNILPVIENSKIRIIPFDTLPNRLRSAEDGLNYAAWALEDRMVLGTPTTGWRPFYKEILAKIPRDAIWDKFIKRVRSTGLDPNY